MAASMSRRQAATGCSGCRWDTRSAEPAITRACQVARPGWPVSLRCPVGPEHRVEVQAVIPCIVALVEEVQARLGARREFRILPQPPLELRPDLAIGQHPAGDLLGDVGLHVFLALEGVVEPAPG